MGLDLNQQWVLASMSFLAAAFSINNFVQTILTVMLPENHGHNERLMFWGIAAALTIALFILLRVYILDTDGVRAKKELLIAQHDLASAEPQMHNIEMMDVMNRKKYLTKQLRRSGV